MKKLSYEEFGHIVMNGESRENPGEAYADYIGIIESAGKTTFGVWTDAESVEHYTTQAEATDAWHAAANELEEGESVYIARFADGDIDEDFPSYLVREDGEIGEYSNGERMWL